MTTTAQRAIARVWHPEQVTRLFGALHPLTRLPIGTTGRTVIAGLLFLVVFAIAERQTVKDGFAVFQHILPAAGTLIALSVVVTLFAPNGTAADRRLRRNEENTGSTRLAWFAALTLFAGALIPAIQSPGQVWLLVTPLWCYGLLIALALRLGAPLAYGLATLSVVQLVVGFVVSLLLPRSWPGTVQPLLVATIASTVTLGLIAVSGRRTPVEPPGRNPWRGRSFQSQLVEWLRGDVLALDGQVREIAKHLVWIGLAVLLAALTWLVVGGQPGLLNRLLLPLTGLAMTRLVAEELILRCQLLDPLARRIGSTGAIVTLGLVSAGLGWITRGGIGLSPAGGNPWAATAAALAAAIAAGLLWRRSRSPLLVVVFRLVVPS